jgi:hypothetical protein
MKTIKHRIYIPIYNCYLTIIVAKNFEKTAKKYDFDDSHYCAAMVHTKEDKKGIKEYFYIQRPSVTYGTIAHEAKHIVNRILRDRGQELDRWNDEAECYLLGYIVNEIHQNINTKTKNRT